MHQLSPKYSPQTIEQQWYSFWEAQNCFTTTTHDDLPNYCIQLPPPNITGSLHMGHALQHTLMDILIRYHRMCGYNTLWQPGMDHAGIATQIMVERQLAAQGKSRQQLGRAGFIAEAVKWQQATGTTILQQMKRLGSSLDWSRTRFTLDDDYAAVVNQVFVTLYQQGYLYRAHKLIYWDTVRQTSVSDLEIRSIAETGYLWHINYHILNSTELLTVATTRPETLFGDMALAVHPDDIRFQHLIGQTALIPLTNRQIKIIADDYVDMNFGTGCLKITPAHDFNDYEIGQRHKLTLLNILNPDGTLNKHVPPNYQGLSMIAARTAVIADLTAAGLLAKIVVHQLNIPRAERDDVILEPFLSTQWFMRMDDLATHALSADIEFIPHNWHKTYQHWLNNIHDWCLSRQLWWGHRIPAYYTAAGEIIVANSRSEAEQLAGTAQLTADDDVLDTWFSSALWCFATLGWPQQTTFLAKFLPSTVLITGFDIIFFWVARMIMLTQKLTQQLPFKNIYINPLIMDAAGEKMSKSKGNVIDPMDIINGISLDELLAKRTASIMQSSQLNKVITDTKKHFPTGFATFGADALRFSLALLATQARYVNFNVQNVIAARNFCNKLFNAAKFILMQSHPTIVSTPVEYSWIDIWILSALAEFITHIKQYLAAYRFDLAAQCCYDFVWHKFCDWYLELAKTNLATVERESTFYTLYAAFEVILRVVHPFMPFLTEELWQAIAPIIKRQHVKSIMLSKFPVIDTMIAGIALYDMVTAQTNHVNQQFMLLQSLVAAVRELKLQHQGTTELFIQVDHVLKDSQLYSTLGEILPHLKALAKLDHIQLVPELDILTTTSSSTTTITITANSKPTILRIMILGTARQAVQPIKPHKKYQDEYYKLQQQLSNPAYLAKAPAQLITKYQQRIQALEALLMS